MAHRSATAGSSCASCGQLVCRCWGHEFVRAPSPDEIRERAEAIRRSWSNERLYPTKRDPYTVPSVGSAMHDERGRVILNLEAA